MGRGLDSRAEPYLGSRKGRILMRRLLIFVVLVGLGWGTSHIAWAQAVKPRFVLIVDTSSSMAEDPSSVDTYGDGSTDHEGCDRSPAAPSGTYPYGDSRLYQAKGAIADTIAAFGSAEFALARFTGINLGQACTATADCPKILPPARSGAASPASVGPASTRPATTPARAAVAAR